MRYVIVSLWIIAQISMVFAQSNHKDTLKNSYSTAESAVHFTEAAAVYQQSLKNGDTASVAYKKTVARFNAKIALLSQTEPGAIRYLVANRDNLNKPDARAKKQCCTAVPVATAKTFLFAQDKNSGSFITLGESLHNKNATTFANMDKETFRKLAIASYEKESRHFFVQTQDGKKLHRDHIIDEIEQNTALGQQFLAIEKHFLQALQKRANWEDVYYATTDASGNFELSGNFASPTGLLATIQLRWRGTPHSFPKVTLDVNGKTIFAEAAGSYDEYTVAEKIAKTTNTYIIRGENGPITKEIEIVFADCG